MPQIHISVRDKIARAARRTPSIVCGNADYEIVFDLDSEWDVHDQKIARFIWGGAYYDVPFMGNACSVPTVVDASEVEIGVYAGDLRTTTPATIACRRSIRGEQSLPLHDEALVEYEHRAVEAAATAQSAATEAQTAATEAQTAADEAAKAATQAATSADRIEALVNRVNTDTESAREHAAQMNEHASATHTRYIFTVGQDDELDFMTEDSCGIYQATNGLRYNDKTLYTVYRYPLTDSARITSAVWHAHLTQQLLLQVSSDGKVWVTLSDSGSQQINSQDYYDLCGVLDLSNAEAVYVRIADSAPLDGFGGAILSDIPVTLDVTHGSLSHFALPPVSTQDEGAFLRVIGGRWRAADTATDAISHVCSYSFLVGQPSEGKYLQEGSNGTLNATCRFNDRTAFTLYRYHIANAAFVRRLSWTAVVGQHLRIECSTDRENWQTVFDAGNSILPFKRTTYDLTDLVNLWDHDDVYIRISSSCPSDGFGGAISTSEGVYLRVERGEPFAWI